MTFEVMIFISANILEAEILIELSRQISEEKVRGNWILSSARFAECAATVAVGTRELVAQKRRSEDAMEIWACQLVRHHGLLSLVGVHYRTH